MKSNQYNNPKDEHITNDDNAATNKDGDNNLEKGEKQTAPPKSDNELTPPATINKSNKGQGPTDENL